MVQRAELQGRAARAAASGCGGRHRSAKSARRSYSKDFVLPVTAPGWTAPVDGACEGGQGDRPGLDHLRRRAICLHLSEGGHEPGLLQPFTEMLFAGAQAGPLTAARAGPLLTGINPSLRPSHTMISLAAATLVALSSDAARTRPTPISSPRARFAMSEPMSEPTIFFSEVNERQGVFHRRAFLMGGLAGAGLLALGGRLAQLQLVEARRYQKLSAGNQFNYRLVSPPRGAIYDRNGVALASNRPNFRLMVTKDKDFDARRPWTSWPCWSHRSGPPLAPAQGPGPRPEEGAGGGDGGHDLGGVLAGQYPRPGAAGRDGRHGRGAGLSVRRRLRPRDRLCRQGLGPRPEDKAEDDPNQDQALLHHPGFRIGKLGVEKAFDGPCAAMPGPTRPRSTPRAARCAWIPRATSRPRPAPTSA
jgi:hypothetical protein